MCVYCSVLLWRCVTCPHLLSLFPNSSSSFSLYFFAFIYTASISNFSFLTFFRANLFSLSLSHQVLHSSLVFNSLFLSSYLRFFFFSSPLSSVLPVPLLRRRARSILPILNYFSLFPTFSSFFDFLFTPSRLSQEPHCLNYRSTRLVCLLLALAVGRLHLPTSLSTSCLNCRSTSLDLTICLLPKLHVDSTCLSTSCLSNHSLFLYCFHLLFYLLFI